MFRRNQQTGGGRASHITGELNESNHSKFFDDTAVRLFAMGSKDSSRGPLPENRQFVTTRWSLVVSAGKVSSDESSRALESLCEIYWYPLYAYARRRVSTGDEAQDLTQAFFVELLEKDFVGSAIPDRGRFRSFLLTAFKHFLSKQWKKAKAQKRGGGRSPISLDFESAFFGT